MESKRFDYLVKFYQKDKLILTKDYGFTTLFFSKGLSKMSKEIQVDIEILVIQNGWTTTYSGVFAAIYLKGGKDFPIGLITYKPTFNYQEIWTRKKIWDELVLIGIKLS